MNDLTFDPEKHEYRYNDAIVSSATQLLKWAGLIDDSWFTEWHGERGRLIHLTCQYYGIGKLALALAKAQGQMCAAKKDNENPFFKSKYADLASVWDACRKPLSDNSLAVIQVTEPQPDGTITVKTILAHASGEFISGVLPINAVKRDPQGIESAITYARRYALAAIVGVSPEDDDSSRMRMIRTLTYSSSNFWARN